MFGFVSCNKEDPGLCMYGTPQADFSVKGKVENARGDALAGVRVVVPYEGFVDWVKSDTTLSDSVVIWEMCDTLYTDAGGGFAWQRSLMPRDSIVYEFRFDDVEKQQYESDTIRIIFLHEEYSKHKTGGAWNVGSAEREITVVLKEKEDE